MRRFLAALLAFAYLSLASATAQKILELDIDRFTREEVVQTSYDTLYDHHSQRTDNARMLAFSVRKNNDTYSLWVDIILPKPVCYDSRSTLTLLLQNNETVRLRTMRTGNTVEEPSGRHSFHTHFYLSYVEVRQLTSIPVVAIRVNHTEGKSDFTLPLQQQDSLMRMLQLIEQAVKAQTAVKSQPAARHPKKKKGR